jgi:hypothetical protein
VVWAYPVVDADILAQTTRQGPRNFVYGAETENNRVHCAILQVDGLITDHPDVWLHARQWGGEGLSAVPDHVHRERSIDNA